MSKFPRWFPVSHDINADEEMWELRERYTDRAGFVWLEILSIADRNEGLVGRDLEQIRNHLASKCRTSRAKVESVLNHGRAKVWLTFNDGLRVSNYKKYHRTRVPNLRPSEPDLTEPIHKSSKKKIYSITLPPFLDVEVWQEYQDHRKRLKAPVTQQVAARLFSRLTELGRQGFNANEVLKKAIDRGWRGLEVEWITNDVQREAAKSQNPLDRRILQALNHGL